MDRACCRNCRHWHRCADVENRGKCHGSTPTAGQEVRLNHDTHIHPAIWPWTSGDDHCGVYSPAVPPQDPAPPEPVD